MPAVSVIIPTFNRRELVLRAIDSVLAQTMDDLELIVVDDGSTDNTAELPVLRKHPQKIRFVRFETNYGVSHARNAGVAISSGSLVAFLDSDDLWHPRKLQRQIAWLTAHPGYAICQTKEIWIRRGRRVNPPATHEKKGGWIFYESLTRCMITPSSVMMTRTLFDRLGGFDVNLPACEDYDLWLRLTSAHQVGLVEENLLTRYGGRPDQLSAMVTAQDQYRLIALQKALSSGGLTPQQAAAVRLTIHTKAAIMARGCLRRGKMEEYERYVALAKRYAHDR